ncbi:MAG: hypothetical protein U9P42_06700 [Candidatus Fermentibacteria bacterium]|nr:hypothetical protein [Candidatus Fermentibacteria bacterium]
MKSSFIVLLIVAVFAFGANDDLGAIHPSGPTGAGTDADVYSQTYDFGLVLNGYSNYTGRYVADDFELTDDYDVRTIDVWMIFTGAQATAMNLSILSDNAGDSDPSTATEIWAEAVPCVNTDTGDDNWGYDIWHTSCTVNTDIYPELDAGQHYYFVTQGETGDNCFIIVSENYVADLCWYNDGSGWVRSDAAFGENSDLFFDFYGELTAIESMTWGSVKALF